MRRICAALLLSALLLSGCAEAPATPSSLSTPNPSAVSDQGLDTISFTDDLGRELELAKPKRTAALIGSFADIWCLAGGKDTLIAAAGDTWTNFDLGLDDSVADLGSVKDPSLEALLAAEPDLILASTNTAADVELLETFETAGIPTAYFEVDNFNDYLRMLEVCAQLTGCPENYDTFGVQVKDQVERAAARQDGSAPKILYIRAAASVIKVKGSEGSVLGEMLADLGCVNVADSDGSLLENLSIEGIIAADPDYIFVVYQGSDKEAGKAALEESLLTNPAWSGLRAVAENRFYVLDHTLYNVKPNARWGEAYEKLADILYPAG
ncbi:MAG: ABC transporter substrate-binding protein [Oscillospiraceae bacterium]|nr:ABC transporter substrate-binding protein [Oscillospiraceae bacterium]